MIAILRQIIFCITAAALFGAAVQALTKDGAMKEVIQMAVGILLILSLVMPLRRGFKLPDFITLPESTAVQNDAQELYTQTLLTQFQTEIEAYVQNLLEQQQCTGTVSAQVYINEDDTAAVRQITVQLQQGNAEALKQKITDDLQLDADKVVITQ